MEKEMIVSLQDGNIVYSSALMDAEELVNLYDKNVKPIFKNNYFNGKLDVIKHLEYKMGNKYRFIIEGDWINDKFKDDILYVEEYSEDNTYIATILKYII